jgi:hypothetical protein
VGSELDEVMQCRLEPPIPMETARTPPTTALERSHLELQQRWWTPKVMAPPRVMEG